MYERALNKDNDIYFENGKVARCGDLFNSTRQSISTLLYTFKGECFTDEDRGTPWFQKILGQGSLAFNVIKEEISKLIQSVENVKKVLSLNLSLDKDRQLFISYAVEISDGKILSGEATWTR